MPPISGGCRAWTRRRRKAAQTAIVLGADDRFDYALALELGWSHAQIQALSHDEYVRWRAYFEWRHAEEEHAGKVAAMRGHRW